MNDGKTPKYAWFDEIEKLRGFGILAVICIHVTANYIQVRKVDLLNISVMTLRMLSDFAIPLFIFISGLVLSIRYYPDLPIKRFLTKRLRVVLVPYLVFSLFYLNILGIIIQVIRHLLMGSALTFSWVRDRFITTLTSSGNLSDILLFDPKYHLWFIALILQFYLVYPLLIKVYGHFEERRRMPLFFFTSFILIITWEWHIKPLFASHLGAHPAKLAFVTYLIYFIVGIFAGRNKRILEAKLGSSNWGGMACIIISTSIIRAAIPVFNYLLLKNAIDPGLQYVQIFGMISNLSLHWFWLIKTIHNIAMIFLLYRLALTLRGEDNLLGRTLTALGRFSFGIYLVHVAFMDMMLVLLKHFSIDLKNAYFYLILFISTSFFSYCSVALLSLLPKSEYLLGRKPAKTVK